MFTKRVDLDLPTCQVQVESVRLNVRTDRLGLGQRGQSDLIGNSEIQTFRIFEFRGKETLLDLDREAKQCPKCDRNREKTHGEMISYSL